MNLEPQIELTRPSLIFRPASFVERINLQALFCKPQPLEVELGSGDGSFIVEWARRNPGTNFIAIERLLGRLRKVDRKGQRADLSNLRALRIEAGYFLEYLLPEKSASAVHVYFPDPWPKRKHLRRRLINEHFVELTTQALVPGGLICLRTDNEDYFAQMIQVFGASPHFQLCETPSALAELLTDFEREYQAQGIRMRRAAYLRTGALHVDDRTAAVV
jgi:tRNA (guanine-N7-)-methyltransferase